jgi:hypothetical protein
MKIKDIDLLKKLIEQAITITNRNIEKADNMGFT